MSCLELIPLSYASRTQLPTHFIRSIDINYATCPYAFYNNFSFACIVINCYHTSLGVKPGHFGPHSSSTAVDIKCKHS